MNKLITETPPGGLPVVLDDLRFVWGQGTNAQGIYQALNNMLRSFSDNMVIQGAVSSGTSPNISITEGWVILDGELLKVDAQTGIDTTTDNTYKKVITFDSLGDKTLENGATIQAFQKNRAKVEGAGGNLVFSGQRIEDFIIILARKSNSNNASLSLKGIVELATRTETLAGTDNIRVVTPDGLNDRLPLAQTVVNIGVWNMSASSVPVNQPLHGLGDFNRIRAVEVMIISDAEINVNPLTLTNTGGVASGSIANITDTTIGLSRRAGGDFDDTAFSVTPGSPPNRGFVTIWHTL